MEVRSIFIVQKKNLATNTTYFILASSLIRSELRAVIFAHKASKSLWSSSRRFFCTLSFSYLYIFRRIADKDASHKSRLHMGYGRCLLSLPKYYLSCYEFNHTNSSVKPVNRNRLGSIDVNIWEEKLATRHIAAFSVSENTTTQISDCCKIGTVDRYGTFTANFKPIRPQIPPEYCHHRYCYIITVIVTIIIGWSIPSIFGWVKTR